MIKHSPNPPPLQDYDSSQLQAAAYRAINHYLNPQIQTHKPSAPPIDGLFVVRTDLETETLLINASQDLASIGVMASHLAFDIDGSQRNVALGICRMVEGVQLLVDEALTKSCRATA
ncbi:MAG: DUF6124 family protein [Pseudomonas proteolytica]|uniref:DUF6124 family protein n=1 Tax=Pseudomonas proteolytica TaxID=219574 RepID=UPI003F39F1B9